METIRCLILKIDEPSKILYCFHRDTFELLKLKIPDAKKATPGQFLIFENPVNHHHNEVLEIHSGRIENAKQEDCVHMKNNGTFEISSWIAFSKNPRHRTFNKTVAFADWYGFVKSDGFEEKLNNGNGYKTNIVLNDLNYKENQTQLFKLKTIKGQVKEEDLENLLNNAMRFEENYLPPIPSSAETVKKRARSKSAKRAAQAKTPAPSLQTRMDELRLAENSAPKPQPRQKPPTPNLQVQMDVVIVVLKKTEDRRIGWLYKTNKAVRLSMSKVGIVQMGVGYKCKIQKIPENNGVEYEVLDIDYACDVPMKFHVKDESAMVEVSVDLRSPCTKFRNFQFFTGIPILNAVNFGMVTVDDEVYNPKTGRTQKWQVAFRDFIGEEHSLRTLALCRLVRQKVPRGFGNLESTEEDKFDCVRRYEWQMIRILGENENLEIETESGNSQHLRDEDDIARQKKVNGRSHN